MERVFRFFIKPNDEFRQIEDKLYADPSTMMTPEADKIWCELFTYLADEADAVVVFDTADADNDNENRYIVIQKILVDGVVYPVKGDQSCGGDADLMSTVVLEALRKSFTDDELNEQLIFETIETTLNRFGISI